MKNYLAGIFALFFVCGASAEIPITNGFADNGKLSYALEKNKIVIDDATYKTPIEKRKAFTNAISSGGKKLIVLYGTVDLSDGKVTDDDHSYFEEFDSSSKRKHDDIIYSVSSNKTIVGTENAMIKFGGLKIEEGSSNVIIRNITFWDAHGSTEYDTKVSGFENKKASCDAILIDYHEGRSLSNGIWIDHCTFTDGKCVDLKRNYNHDGQIDIRGGKNITISYCEFYNHDKVMLIAPGDSYTRAEDRQITLHHNYFHDVVQRLPRSRGCQMHAYNNMYDKIGVPANSGSIFGPGIGSLYILENNYIGRTQGAVLKYYDSSKNASTESKIYQKGNSQKIDDSNVDYDKVDTTKKLQPHLSEDPVFRISYSYVPEEADEVKRRVPLEAGASKVRITVNGITY